MKILSVGPLSGATNTCAHRHKALVKLADSVDAVNTQKKPISLWYRIAHHLFLMGLPVKLPDNSNANKEIKQLVSQNKYDIVWIDKGLTISKDTLLYIKKISPDTRIVSYTGDTMSLRHNQSQDYLGCIPYYDCHFTTKSYILEDMRRLGAKHIQFVNNGYDPAFFYPRELSPVDIASFGEDVGFIGMWEKERCESILFLVENGIRVRVYGGRQWEKYKNYHPNLTIITHGLYSEDYPKALQAFKISLCFLRKMNFDRQTNRTMEILTCGGFMLAERTDEHLALFEEGKEAAFFSSNEELLEKCEYYLAHEEERKQIALAGMERCRTSGYSYEEIVGQMLQYIAIIDKIQNE
jgi:spore maturation protein CgeB